MKRTAEQILRDTEGILATAKQGLIMLQQPSTRRAGLSNVIVFGRAITNVLQNLRGDHKSIFDPWYARYVDEMKRDDLATYFYQLRSQILKQGQLNLSNHITFSGNPHEIMRRCPKPQYAKAFFIGDQNGGSGWELEFPDGKKEIFYVDLPTSSTTHSLEITLSLPSAPSSLHGIDISILATRYLDYFISMVADAKRTFLSPTL